MTNRWPNVLFSESIIHDVQEATPLSGIAGIFRFDGTPVDPGLIEQMTAAIAYRGPDGINHWAKDSVALGQCILCTTPESLVENQPLTNEDESLVLVMDGRVDNPETLRIKKGSDPISMIK